MSARHQHKPVRKILCHVCNTRDTTYHEGHQIISHRSSCTSDKIELCMQDLQGGGYSYHTSKCLRAVRGYFKGGSWQWTPGAPACGVHLAHERRAIEKIEAERSSAEVGAYLKDQMSEKLKLIEQLTGIVAELHYRTGYGANQYKRYLDSKYILVPVDDFIAAIDTEVEVEQ